MKREARSLCVSLRDGSVSPVNNQPLRDVQELIDYLDRQPKVPVLTIDRDQRSARVLIEF